MSPLSGRPVVGAFIVAAVVAAIGAAFVYVGSPGEARQRRFDDQRVSDLGEIMRSLNLYWRTNTRLPASLEDAAQGGRGSVPRDPESDQPYAYRIVDERHYELCATFARPSGEVPAMHETPFRGHAAGRQCFTLEVADSR